MTQNQRIKDVDELIQEIDNIFENYYVKSKDVDNPYRKVIEEVDKYKNEPNFQQLKYAVKNKINTYKQSMNLINTHWTTIFIVVGLAITVIADIILNNYEVLGWGEEWKRHIISFVICTICIEVILWGGEVLGSGRKNFKKRCYYEMVYDIFTS